MHRSFHAADDGVAGVIHEFHAHLHTLSLGTGPAQHLGDLAHDLYPWWRQLLGGCWVFFFYLSLALVFSSALDYYLITKGPEIYMCVPGLLSELQPWEYVCIQLTTYPLLGVPNLVCPKLNLLSPSHLPIPNINSRQKKPLTRDMEVWVIKLGLGAVHESVDRLGNVKENEVKDLKQLLKYKPALSCLLIFLKAELYL